jgi:hypothetical protein
MISGPNPLHSARFISSASSSLPISVPKTCLAWPVCVCPATKSIVML